MTQQETFISTIAPVIRREALARGYKYPSAIIAQACIESGWGQSLLARKYYNYFGMKCGSSWRGKSVNMNTQEEFKPGILTGIRDNFRAYDSQFSGVQGYFEFISMDRYKSLKSATSPRDYLERIKAAGYATSSVYVDRVYSIVTKYNLTIWDTPAEETADKDLRTIARRVIRGEFGVMPERKRRIEAAGYDYEEVRGVVNAYYRGEWR